VLGYFIARIRGFAGQHETALICAPGAQWRGKIWPNYWTISGALSHGYLLGMFTMTTIVVDDRSNSAPVSGIIPYEVKSALGKKV
jgi:hypothetical protein